MKIWLNSTLMTVFAVIAAGASPCPTIGHSTYQGDNQAYLTAGGGCNTLVTVNANGTITITVVNSNPYDGSDDTLVGVVNNSATPLTSLTLSGSGISGFEGDGICVFGAGGIAGDTFTSGSSAYCGATQLNGTDPQDYYGPNMTFTNYTNGNAVTVNFTTAVPANGGTSFFSLEEPPSSSLIVTGPGGPTPTPAPSSVWLIVIGFCALGAFYFYRTRVVRR
jgi:hypothetical protein